MRLPTLSQVNSASLLISVAVAKTAISLFKGEPEEVTVPSPVPAPIEVRSVAPLSKAKTPVLVPTAISLFSTIS